jgi:hypothetical protein
MSRRRSQRRREKRQRHAVHVLRDAEPLLVVREATRINRLAYTRTQAQALGISTSTFNRRVLPYVETVETGSARRLVPVDELERFLAERRQPRAERRRPARRGRKSGLSSEVVVRIRDERAKGNSFGQIARQLNADGVQTSQGGREWWASTIRAVLSRPSPPEATRVSAERS